MDLPGIPLLALEQWPADEQSCVLWRQQRKPLLKKREKWRTRQNCQCRQK
jgi:hypothetical protein